MGERLGYAIIGRFVYTGSEEPRCIERADTYTLDTGEGLLFFGNGDEPQEPLRFIQSEIIDVLQETDLSTMQILAIVEETYGGLLFTDLTPENTKGVGPPTSRESRVMIAEYGKITIAGIWGETEIEARTRLAELQEMRARRN